MRNPSDHLYTALLDVVISQSAVLNAIGEDLDNACAAVDRMESFGPLVDPTAFLRTPDAFDKLNQQREILQAAIAFRNRINAAMRPPEPRASASGFPQEPANA